MLRRDIVKLTRSLSVYDAPFPQLPGLMQGFEQHLEQVGRALPNGPHLSAARIAQLLPTPWLARQVLVHLSFHQAYADLYRILLRGYREAAPAIVLASLDPALVAKAADLSLHHATAIVDILATLNQHAQRPQLLEFDTAICGYHATRVLLFLAQFGGVPRPLVGEEWALSRAELCLASLRRFFPTSRLVRPILDEMKRAIAVFSTRSATTTPSRLASPGPGGASGGKDPAMGLSAAARVRQRLAIHSLLRQADFTDDEDGGESRASEPGQWIVSPGPTAGLDVLSRAASTLSVQSPGHSPGGGGDLWEPRWFSGGGFTEQWDADLLPLAFSGGGGGVGGGGGGGPRTPSQGFTFPWLQRWGGAGGGLEEAT